MTQNERIKKLEKRLTEIEQTKSERKKVYERSMSVLKKEADGIKSRLYDLGAVKK